MMRDNKKRHGLSLVELLVTTTIVGMIMMGIVSIDFALRTNEQEQSRSALVSLRTSAMMFDITSTASQALGNMVALNGEPARCIQYANSTTDSTNYICIYRDINQTATMTDDEWTCYTYIGTDMHKCTFDAADGPASCTDLNATSDRIIGRVTADVFQDGDDPVVVNDRTNLDFYFQITLKSRYDPSVLYSAAVAQEYLNNPKIKMTSRVTPASCVP